MLQYNKVLPLWNTVPHSFPVNPESSLPSHTGSQSLEPPLPPKMPKVILSKILMLNN